MKVFVTPTKFLRLGENGANSPEDIKQPTKLIGLDLKGKMKEIGVTGSAMNDFDSPVIEVVGPKVYGVIPFEMSLERYGGAPITINEKTVGKIKRQKLELPQKTEIIDWSVGAASQEYFFGMGILYRSCVNADNNRCILNFFPSFRYPYTDSFTYDLISFLEERLQLRIRGTKKQAGFVSAKMEGDLEDTIESDVDTNGILKLIGEQGILQKELSTILGVNSREVSRVVRAHLKAGVIYRKKELSEGRWTYRLFVRKKLKTVGRGITFQDVETKNLPLHEMKPGELFSFLLGYLAACYIDRRWRKTCRFHHEEKNILEILFTTLRLRGIDYEIQDVPSFYSYDLDLLLGNNLLNALSSASVYQILSKMELFPFEEEPIRNFSMIKIVNVFSLPCRRIFVDGTQPTLLYGTALVSSRIQSDVNSFKQLNNVKS